MKADIILISDAIFDSVRKEPYRGGVALKENRILGVSGEQEILDAWTGGETQVIDCGAKTILPGLIDAHMHLFTGGFVNSPYMLMALFEAKSEQECADMVAGFAKENPQLEKISGMGWFPGIWETPGMPGKKSLDAVMPDKPVYLLSADCHTFWLNSKALEECGITCSSEVSFGAIGKTPDGEPDGLLYEIEACGPANENAFALERDKMKELQYEFYQRLVQTGITSATNMSVTPVPEKSLQEIEVARELELQGDLPVRIHFYPSLGLTDNMDRVAELKAKYHSERLRFSGLKQFVDGVTSTYTAALLEPYEDKPGRSGEINYPFETLDACIRAANAKGVGVRVHAIGDRAVRVSLDLFEKSLAENGPGSYVNTIEHVEVISPEDIPRFAALGVIASMQPLHLILDQNEQLERIGKARARYAWPLASLLASGATLAFGSDYPVSDINPFPNIHAAVTRQDDQGNLVGVSPQEAIPLADALIAFTAGGAAAVGRSHELGTLEAGKLGDLAVLDRNIFTCDPGQIPEIRVEMTLVDGKIVYKNA